MKRTVLTLLGMLVLTSSLRAADVKADPGRDIEICFVVDTTGSMSGLIEGAKQKIWAITNDVIQIKPKPPSIMKRMNGSRLPSSGQNAASMSPVARQAPPKAQSVPVENRSESRPESGPATATVSGQGVR